MNYLASYSAWLGAAHAILAQARPGGEQNALPTAGPQPLDLPSLALATGAVALVLLAAMVVSSLLSARQGREVNSPRCLLRQLCDAHGFRRRQQRLLLKAARVLSVQQPARFFLEPKLISQAAEHPAFSSRRGDLVQIAGELFGPVS